MKLIKGNNDYEDRPSDAVARFAQYDSWTAECSDARERLILRVRLGRLKVFAALGEA